MPSFSRLVLALVVLPGLVAAGLAIGLATTASAHEERPAGFPDGTGHRPHFLGYDNPQSRVVCKSTSAAKIRSMPAGPVKHRNQRLLRQCAYSSIQDAINSVKQRRTSVYVLPGVYHEEKYAGDKRSNYCSHLGTASAKPLVSSEYIGSLSSPDPGAERKAAAAGESNPIALSYADQRRCPHNLNLIAVFGDRTPDNKSIHCDSKICGIQIVGTGRNVKDVIVDNRFHKLNGIRADRAGGLYLRNITFQQAEFNSIYVLETDGFVLDHVLARGNDEYGILAFASDHGLIQNSEAYYNGDSGFYPGSGSDLNADNLKFKVIRYAIEIRNNNSHDNTLGYSGTAGNSIWAHDNDFHDNATGIVTDSLFPGHPGLPQDHARWDHNRVFSNNNNYYVKYVDSGVCGKPMEKRGYIHGTVCPVIPTPVGTGVVIAGGNYNSTDHNWIYDNWRAGTMQFWVPAALRDDYDPTHQLDTSNYNHTFANHMGSRPDGKVLENGMDHWWDDQGLGNCWERNHYADGQKDDNFVIPPASCKAGGSILVPGIFAKDAGFLTCSQYDRANPIWQHPPLCEWFDSPTRPGKRFAATAAASPESGAFTPEPIAALAGGLVLAFGFGFRRRKSRAA